VKDLWEAWLPKEDPPPEPTTFTPSLSRFAQQAFADDRNDIRLSVVRVDDEPNDMSLEDWGDHILMETINMAMAFVLARAAKEHADRSGPPRRLDIRVLVTAED
jgi:hypothetical protein